MGCMVILPPLQQPVLPDCRWVERSVCGREEERERESETPCVRESEMPSCAGMAMTGEDRLTVIPATNRQTTHIHLKTLRDKLKL